ncbi:ABC-type polysaccharide/polyol phosphate transport system ATPase subunit [Leucobacter exalbidus]|uniref:ABC-type polysaccharide/polyol phosphate transport system ATPase subunit n=1 Tax=Leucobacter exalbidus TaxID=662960 RepID=A0A940T0P3_9MICO|nr:ABC-type polysaccharide/polyol phosphate transport system ATPase subunit [Leucobacter exalbidus]
MPRISNPHDSTYAAKPTIVLQDVVKSFSLNHTHSFKESFVSLFSRQERATEFRALNGISFEVGEAESVAVMGRNGSGKSTALKIISGVQKPDEGWVRTRGRVGGLLEVGAGFHPDLTGNDNIYLNAAILGMSKEETDERYEDIVNFSGISKDFLESEVKRYSSGMKSRLGFSVAVHTEVDVLLVDEVLSVGDAMFKAKCNEKILEMREQGKTMFVVSHSTGTVRKLCQRGIVLHQGEMIFDGPIDDAIEYVRPPKPNTKKHKAAITNTTSFIVAPKLYATFEDPRRNLGQPTEHPEPIQENGGGVIQRFEYGVIVHSTLTDQAFEIRDGALLRDYIENGGPAGSWGFPEGRARGSYERDGFRSIQMQHGTASWRRDSIISFTPTDNAHA